MSAPKPIARVVSVCSNKDMDTWSVACSYITRFIEADEYLIVVPDHEVELFRPITCSPYKVVPESFYVGNLKERLKDLLPTENHDRIGWYLQQFIKIEAAKGIQLDEDPQQLVLIWDADTVPLKSLSFIDTQGRVLYYCGTENHAPYFDFIKRVLPWAARQKFSFIAQCFPAKISWVRDFCRELESDDRGWVETIIANLDLSQRAGFSEYESLGTYIWGKYSDQVAINNHAWERNGRSLVGKPVDLSALEFAGLANFFDFISFEAWDVNRGFRALIKARWRRLKLSRIGLKAGKNNLVGNI